MLTVAVDYLYAALPKLKLITWFAKSRHKQIGSCLVDWFNIVNKEWHLHAYFWLTIAWIKIIYRFTVIPDDWPVLVKDFHKLNQLLQVYGADPWIS